MDTLFDPDELFGPPPLRPKTERSIAKAEDTNAYKLVNGVWEPVPRVGVMLTSETSGMLAWRVLDRDESVECGTCRKTAVGLGRTVVKWGTPDDPSAWHHVGCLLDGVWLTYPTDTGKWRSKTVPSRQQTRIEKGGIPGIVARFPQCEVTLVTDDEPDDSFETFAAMFKANYAGSVGAHYKALKITPEWLLLRRKGAERVPSLLDLI